MASLSLNVSKGSSHPYLMPNTFENSDFPLYLTTIASCLSIVGGRSSDATAEALEIPDSSDRGDVPNACGRSCLAEVLSSIAKGTIFIEKCEGISGLVERKSENFLL